MSNSNSVSRNIIRGTAGEFLRKKIPTMGKWLHKNRQALAADLKIQPETLTKLSISKMDPYSPLLLFDLDDWPFEIVLLTKTTPLPSKPVVTLDPIGEGAPQALMRRLVYTFLEQNLPDLPEWLSNNTYEVARSLRVLPALIFELSAQPVEVLSCSQPLRMQWQGYTVQLLARAKRRRAA